MWPWAIEYVHFGDRSSRWHRGVGPPPDLSLVPGCEVLVLPSSCLDHRRLVGFVSSMVFALFLCVYAYIIGFCITFSYIVVVVCCSECMIVTHTLKAMEGYNSDLLP